MPEKSIKISKIKLIENLYIYIRGTESSHKISNNKNAGQQLIARIALLVNSKVEGSFESFFTLQTSSMLQ